MTKKNYFIFYFPFLILFISSCKNIQQADTIIYNAQIYTVDKKFSQKSAMAIKEGKILAIGSDSKIRKKFSAKNIQNAEKQYIYPGFIDAHCHFVGYAENLSKVMLYGTKSIDEIIEKVNEFAQNNPEGWIYGFGWSQNDSAGMVNEFPNKEKLDLLYPNRPVYLKRIDGHIALANQTALNFAGITSETPHLQEGIEVKNGKLTGILMDKLAEKLESNIPPISNENLQKRMLQAQEDCFDLGLTTISDAGLDNQYIHLIQNMQNSGELKLRIYAMLNPTKENFVEFLTKKPYKTEKLSICAVKIYGDGSLGSRGACLLKPYHDKPEQSGFLLHSPIYFDSLANLISKTDFQICTHAIGDSANRLIINTYAKYLKGKNDKRWRIEHAQVVSENDFSLFGKYSIIPSVQPTHATSDMYWAEARLGNERVKGAYAYQKLLQQNGWLPLGTDFPVEYLQPLYTFYAAVSRQDAKKFPEKGFQMENALTRTQALKGMTIWAAKSNFEEKEKGSLEKGKYADFVIMKEDLMKDDLLKIRNANVLQTWINGERVK